MSTEEQAHFLHYLRGLTHKELLGEQRCQKNTVSEQADMLDYHQKAKMKYLAETWETPSFNPKREKWHDKDIAEEQASYDEAIWQLAEIEKEIPERLRMENFWK